MLICRANLTAVSHVMDGGEVDKTSVHHFSCMHECDSIYGLTQLTYTHLALSAECKPNRCNNNMHYR